MVDPNALKLAAAVARGHLFVYAWCVKSLLVTVAFGMLSACHAQPQQSMRATPPSAYLTVRRPPPLKSAAGSRSEQPSANASWLDGYWTWKDEGPGRGQWIWIEGRWHEGPAGMVWEPPVCVETQNQIRFYEGFWRNPEHDPPDVYHAPNRIRIAIARLPPGQQTQNTTSAPVEEGDSGVQHAATVFGCDPSDAIAQAGGAFEIKGSGFTESVEATLAERNVPIKKRQSDLLTIIIPRTSPSGTLRVIQDGKEIVCGEISVSSKR